MDVIVETVSKELAVPPPRRVMFDGFNDAVGPDGETVAVRMTVPAKLLMLVTLMVDAPDEPAVIVRLPGLGDSEKSGATKTTVKLTITECDRLPLVPVTVAV